MDNKILNKCIFGAMLLSLAACTQDELADGSNTLPEGQYPLEIASVTMDVSHSQQPWSADAPQTRVSESDDRNSSVWDGGERIGVRIANGNETAVYTLQDDRTTLQPADKPLYWKNTTASKVCAWFPADGKVDLSNQASSLAYALFAETTDVVDYNTTDIKLPFEHKLAKVRVVLEGEKKDGVTDVKINTFTSCTLHADGALTAGNKDYIPMVKTTYKGETCWEANVVPVPEHETTDYEITHVKINDKEIIPLSTPLAPLAAKVNKIGLKVNKKVTEIKGGETITEPGDYIVTGSFTQGLTLNGNDISLTLDGATASIGNAIKVTGGSPVIIVKGTSNSFSGDGAGILISPNANVTIQGSTENASDSKLAIKVNSAQPGIGSADESSCGNITIENVTLDVTSTSSVGGAAIGTSGNFGSGCGDIEITNSIINATAGPGAAAIGMGSNIDCGYSIGDITITNSQLTIKTQVNNLYSTTGPGIGLGGIPDHSATSGYQVCGKITIRTTESKEAFFSRFDTGEGFKAGKTSNSKYWSFQQWGGIEFNGETLADGNSNGYK